MTFEDIFTIPILVNALQSRGDSKVLSLPRILTNDHQQAQIKVTDQEFFTNTSEQSSGSTVTSLGGKEEAGTTLLITPHISGEKNYLRLDIEQSIEEFQFSRRIDLRIPPPKSTRKLVTSVTIPDSQTVAIGGFTFDSQSDSVRKIPLLGDLPLLGFLFQQREIRHTKRNIYLFVTPRIMREDSFQDLLQHSHDAKLEAQSFGANVERLDKFFGKYQAKYNLKPGSPEPVYMFEYKTPPPEKETPESAKPTK